MDYKIRHRVSIASRAIIIIVYFYRLNFGTEYNPKPILIKGNGDGVVNERSLIGCEYWKKASAQRNHKIYEKVFPGIDHLRILHSAGPINYIVAILTGHQDYPRANEHLNQKL